MIQPIIFHTHEDLRRFSEMASKQDFNIYISTPMGQLDAKSLLALFTILGKEVNVVAPDHADANRFCSFLQEYGKPDGD
jgi:hypothetical protein